MRLHGRRSVASLWIKDGSFCAVIPGKKSGKNPPSAIGVLEVIPVGWIDDSCRKAGGVQTVASSVVGGQRVAGGGRRVAFCLLLCFSTQMGSLLLTSFVCCEVLFFVSVDHSLTGGELCLLFLQWRTWKRKD